MDAEGRALLERARIVHVAWTSDEGRPILRAVRPVLDGDLIAFHGVVEGIGRRAVVAAHEVIGETYAVCVQAEGVLEEVARGMAVRIESLTCTTELGDDADHARVIAELWRRGDVAAVDFLARRFPELAFFRRGGLTFTCVLTKKEVDAVLDLLADVYWLEGIATEQRRRAIEQSSATVIARDGDLVVAFARAVSDGRTAWIYDVVVRDAGRRGGIGSALIRLLLDHPAVRDARKIRLATRDAAEFYRRFGFVDLDEARAKRAYVSQEMVLER